LANAGAFSIHFHFQFENSVDSHSAEASSSRILSAKRRNQILLKNSPMSESPTVVSSMVLRVIFSKELNTATSSHEAIALPQSTNHYPAGVCLRRHLAQG
jgi:hypothetical protein